MRIPSLSHNSFVVLECPMKHGENDPGSSLQDNSFSRSPQQALNGLLAFCGSEPLANPMIAASCHITLGGSIPNGGTDQSKKIHTTLKEGLAVTTKNSCNN
ncbi:hypothetical protein Nepgr_014924 [Nepenthes gracilis]|uniref:Uncharacterized protein n=1 Tax=Nepenthes gracilis TaxID=150966 RepID=A0AAD3SKD6_NEPGR|nr:hypothetical protein Nepgr_014924 [Nepenthes gracilis]